MGLTGLLIRVKECLDDDLIYQDPQYSPIVPNFSDPEGWIDVALHLETTSAVDFAVLF